MVIKVLIVDKKDRYRDVLNMINNVYNILVDVNMRGKTQLTNISFVIFTKNLNLMKCKIINNHWEHDDYEVLSFYLKKKPTI